MIVVGPHRIVFLIGPPLGSLCLHPLLVFKGFSFRSFSFAWRRAVDQCPPTYNASCGKDWPLNCIDVTQSISFYGPSNLPPPRSNTPRDPEKKPHMKQERSR